MRPPQTAAAVGLLLWARVTELVSWSQARVRSAATEIRWLCDIISAHNKHIMTRTRIQTAGLAFGRNRSVFLSCM